jgi:hypothetical protein
VGGIRKASQIDDHTRSTGRCINNYTRKVSGCILAPPYCTSLRGTLGTFDNRLFASTQTLLHDNLSAKWPEIHLPPWNAKKSSKFLQTFTLSSPPAHSFQPILSSLYHQGAIIRRLATSRSLPQNGQSAEVVDLLSHLAYIDNANRLWFHDTRTISYMSPLNLRRMDNYESKRYLFEPPEENLPAHVFSLTNGKLYGIWLLLNTEASMLFRIFSRSQLV